jgi:DNA-binding NarL/FixJ family response regulator
MMKQLAILVVDDSPLIISRLADLLSELPNVTAVHAAGSYEKAVEVLPQVQPDVAVLDINLPGKSGIEVLKYIKTNAPAVTVIMLTNQSGDYYRDLCKKLGADYFLDKSIGFDEAPNIINELAERKS